MVEYYFDKNVWVVPKKPNRPSGSMFKSFKGGCHTEYYFEEKSDAELYLNFCYPDFNLKLDQCNKMVFVDHTQYRVDDVIKWCENHIGLPLYYCGIIYSLDGNWIAEFSSESEYGFRYIDDFMLFKLTWG